MNMQNRIIKFRYNCEDASGAKFQIIKSLTDFLNSGMNLHSRIQKIVSVDEFTGEVDKNGKEIFTGDIIRSYQIETEYQTHTGDNIPCGSYTEPCGSNAKCIIRPVIFSNCAYTTSPVDQNSDEWKMGEWEQCLLCKPTLDKMEISDIIYPRPHGRNEPMPDSEILEIAQDMFNDIGVTVNSIDEAISLINDIEVIGNIYENPNLL